MDRNLAKKALDILNRQDINVINNPKSIVNKLFGKNKKVTIVTAAYNAAFTVQKCIDSVIEQSFPFKQIEFIIVDDHSTDETPNILLKNAKSHSNITVVILNENTGNAAMPRNIGIELATTDKIMFLDSDDWLAKNAISKLVIAMQENDDDIVLGKTVKVVDKGESVHAEFISYKERKHLSPLNIPYLLYHMGPPAKLMKTSIIKENNIRFPEMKFGEDKFFLFRVLQNSSKASTITAPTYYVNRLSSNSSSLTRTTDLLDKRSADMDILNYMFDKKLPMDQEKEYMKRLIEYDLVKSCDSVLFVNSEEKQRNIEFIREALNMLEERPYDIVEIFDSPLYQAAARLIEKEKDQDFIKLFKWYKLDKNKHIIIRDGIAFYNVKPFENNHQFKFIPIPLLVRAKDAYVENDQYVQTFEIYGDQIDKVHHVLIRDRNRIGNELEVPVKINGNIGEFRADYKYLNMLDSSLFSILLRYDGHRLTNIKRLLESQVTYENRKFVFYTTKANNVGLLIKEK